MRWWGYLLIALAGAVALAVLIYIFAVPSGPAGGTPTPTFPPSACDPSLWQHVYFPGRLEIIDPCKAVTGVIDSVRWVPDGDFHININLDPPFKNLLNPANIKSQNGDLVTEVICAHFTPLPAAIKSCRGYENKIVIPPVKTHVEITGSYVLDNDHGWMEIHPVSFFRTL